MVIVDVRAHGGRGDTGIPTDAYFAVEEIRDDGTATQRTFTHVPTTIDAEEAEEIGVEHLLRDVSASGGAASSSLLTTQSLSNRVASQLESLRGLHARLVEISEYLNDVRKNKMPVNHQIIYQVQEIVGLLPQLGGDVDLGKAFRVQVNDQNVMVYLGLIIRTVLALHNLSTSRVVEREPLLTRTVDNRIANVQQEIDDSKSPEEKKNEAAAEAAGVKAEDVKRAKEENADDKDK
jgi:26S proteasome regulatory subunit N8